MTTSEKVRAALSWLEAKSTKRDRENLVRFGINATKAYGVSMANIQALARRTGRDHELAAALWKTGWYEARLLTAFVDDPARVTAVQMERWCRDFDNWGICDTVCFHLFDRTPHAWTKVSVSWALRLIGRRNAALNPQAVAVARRLAASDDATARWIGKGAVKELTSPLVMRQLRKRAK